MSHAIGHKPPPSIKNVSGTSSAENKLPGAPSIKIFPQNESTYVCSICKYFCDSQRTLKAHMWKHLGHKNLQYPTFQNGPLSVYDDTPLAAKNFVSHAAELQQWRPSQPVTLNNAVQLGRTIKMMDSNADAIKRHLDLQGRTARMSRESSPQRVIVQKIQQVSDTKTTCCDSVDLAELNVGESNNKNKMRGLAKDDSKKCGSANDTDVSCIAADLRSGTSIHTVEGDDKSRPSSPKIRKKDADCYSATEKTAATLLSLLRQGIYLLFC